MTVQWDQVKSTRLNFIISSGFKCTQNELQENATEVKFIIKQELARRIWGEHGLYRILLDQDAQLLKSFNYLDQAAALLNN